MSLVGTDCCTPCTPEVTLVPGSPGVPGADGTNGINAFSFVTASFVVPAINSNVTVSVGTSAWMTVGQNIFIETAGNFEVVSFPTAQSVVLKYLDYTGNTNAGNTITAGAQVSPSGVQAPLSAALPTALTDSTTGTASNTLAPGTGVETLIFYIEAATIANGDLMTNYVPGYNFKILKFEARCAKPVTTGAKAATLNLEIDTTNITGGVISLAGTYALGAAQAGTAVTGANTGTNTQSISIEAAAVTAFVEGAFWLIIEIQNMDTASAVASLADHINDLITALT